MERFIKAGRISAYNMRMLTENIRIPVMIVIVFLFIVQNLSSVLLFSKSVDIPVTPYGFVFLVNDFTCQFVMIAGAVVIFSNAPFENDGHSYMLFRAGRLPWALGQVIYIFKMSTLYISSLAAATIIPFIGNLTFRAEWGKIWGTLAKTDEGSRFGLIFSIPESIIREYAPANVLLISILLEWACVVWLGLLIYFGNKITGKSLGTIVGIFFTLLDICIANDWLDSAYRFSPVSLAQINRYSGYALKYKINLAYGVRFFVFGILVLIVLCLLANYIDKIKRLKYDRRKR